MNERRPEPEIVFRSPSHGDCLEARLVLESVGISSEMLQRSGDWCLVVSDDQVNAAFAELQSYRNDRLAEATQSLPQKPLVFGGAIAGVVYYAIFLLSVAVLAETSAYGIDWRAVGQMNAGEVMNRQWWRTITALTLHADAGHLLSNLVFGSVFGGLAGRLLGGGVAWLAIVLAGALGNWMNAVIRDGGHTSIGASTAVFAALGILVAHALHPRHKTSTKALVRWSPLIGGVLLLSFMGLEGERTDVLAHVTGFIAGMVFGWVGCRLPEAWLASSFFQMIAGVFTGAIVIGAWVQGTQ
ncbi:rhomboid family intramembrane serine protease [Rhodopirellula sp. P2]|uniref:rhomboid family intramembrane serine protease n=1 Tax=Rhodopirellula sp. P2 TaxID=2127060 RepID=UPI00236894DC|nr:rhomboid family intramembrane serine protease [Rhodopirellula sp. P2]WDQ15712.1 rhomboid family intramembrane serine protease [Rhodopirellula sp. P2]